MDNTLPLNSIHHSGSSRYVFPAQAQFGNVVTIRLRVGLEVPVRQVFLRTAPDGEQHLTPLQPEELDAAAACHW